jgi:hypothetical protein
MVENDTYGVIAVFGLIFIIIAIGVAVDIALILHTIAVWNTLWVIPMGILILGWNMLWFFGLANFMHLGR